MKKRNLFISLGLALGLGIGVFAGLSARQEAKEAKAVTYEYDVYVDISATDFEEVYCHNWGAEGTTWPGTKMELVSGSLYGIDLKDSGNTSCIFNNGSGTKTGDLTVNLHKVFVMDNGTSGDWQDLDDIYDTSDYSPSADTMRIFVNNADLTNWTNNSETKVRCWGSSSYTWVGGLYNLTWIQNVQTNSDGASEQWYGYADVPTDITGFAVVRCSKTSDRRVWDYAPTVDGETLTTTAVAARVYKIQEYGTSYSYSATTGDSAAGVALMTAIFNAYNTCSSSKLNGWGAYSNLNTNFFGSATSEALNAEVRSLGGSSNYKVSDHIACMALGAGAGSRPHSLAFVSSLQSNNSPILIIVIVGSATLLATAGYFMIKRRKED